MRTRPWLPTPIEALALLAAAAVVFVLVRGCHHLRQEAAKLPQSEAEYLLISVSAAQLNASQTNWTVLVVPRTNSFKKP